MRRLLHLNAGMLGSYCPSIFICISLISFLELVQQGWSYSDILKFLTLVASQKGLDKQGRPISELILKKQSDQGLHCLQFGQAFCEIQP